MREEGNVGDGWLATEDGGACCEVRVQGREAGGLLGGIFAGRGYRRISCGLSRANALLL